MDKVAVILAAGLGTRMKSSLPKVLHAIAGQPILNHLIDACLPVFTRIVVVSGGDPAIGRAASPHEVVVQTERNGTASAAKAALNVFGDGLVTVLYGDNPLIRSANLAALTDLVSDGRCGLALLATRPPNPGAFGRVVAEGGLAQRIVEFSEATEEERAIGLCNIGGFTGRARDMARWLTRIENANAKSEYYLTDLVTLARDEAVDVGIVEVPWEECLGINSRIELAAAEAALQRRLRAALLDAGVTMTAPETVFLSTDTRIAPDVVIEPNVIFGPGVSIETGARIRAFSHLEGCVVAHNAVVGPYARVRPGSHIGMAAHVGNFVELKATRLGAGAKANHLTYLGDSEIGPGTNIGAGTITCNYDGVAKHRTIIGADAFIGSDVALVAPVNVGDRAIIAAGSVITEDVPPDSLALARSRQVNKAGRGTASKRIKDNS
jgi:bifunctional UDP-N-acetylglucosamine pyrophosphorylase/glucosamine-1-phosphate N-acetyltransferase